MIKDFHGNPVRADWQHVVNARQVQQNNVGFVGGSVAKEVFSICGYTDVVMVNPANTSHVDSPWHVRNWLNLLTSKSSCQ